MLIRAWRRWRRRRVLAQHAIQNDTWAAVRKATPLLETLAPEREQRLREFTTLFVFEKDFYGAGGFEVNPVNAAMIGASACLTVLDLGYEWLDGWHSIFVFPGQFRNRRRTRDEMGLEGEDHRVLAGEASYEGGLVFSWSDVEEDLAAGNDGQNVVIHEIAHKLDMLNGDADGFPPLHRGMSRKTWSSVMQAAYDDLGKRLDRGQEPAIDPYAATDPAEFFAVTSEYYFEFPEALEDAYPAVLEQLDRFYRPQRLSTVSV